MRCRGGLETAEHFSKAADFYRGVRGRERDQILDAPTDLHMGGGKKTNATGADISSLLRAIHGLAAEMDDLNGQLQFVTLRTALFQ